MQHDWPFAGVLPWAIGATCLRCVVTLILLTDGGSDGSIAQDASVSAGSRRSCELERMRAVTPEGERPDVVPAPRALPAAPRLRRAPRSGCPGRQDL